MTSGPIRSRNTNFDQLVMVESVFDLLHNVLTETVLAHDDNGFSRVCHSAEEFQLLGREWHNLFLRRRAWDNDARSLP